MTSPTGRRRSAREPKKRKLSFSPDDTIEVRQKSSAIPISDDSDVQILSASGPPMAVNDYGRFRPLEGPNRPWGRKGKAPVQNSARTPAPGPAQYTLNEDDHVEPYEISDSSDIDEDDDGLDDDTRSIISLSSAASESASRPSDRPWREFDSKTREQWELMYVTQTSHEMGGSWEITEDYQRELDEQMLLYIEDFPLPKWILPQEKATSAYLELMKRRRLRETGAPIYGRERMPGYANSNAARFPQAQNAPRMNFMGAGQALSVPSNAPSMSPAPPQPQQPPQYAMQPPMSYPNYSPQQMRPPPLQQYPQHHMPAHYGPPPPGMMPMPPPQHMLQSQPYTQPMPVYLPPNLGRPAGMPQQMAYGPPPPGYQVYPQTYYGPAPAPEAPRVKKATPVPSTPPPPPPTPPYKARPRPSDRKPPPKTSKRTIRKTAEAEEFPWEREMNFAEAKANTSWDDSIYEPETLKAMEAIRIYNAPIIDQIDQKIQDQHKKWRSTRAAKKKGQPSGDAENTTNIDNETSKDAAVELSMEDAGESSPVGDTAKDRKKKEPRMKNDAGGDPYHSGNFTFASAKDEEKAAGLEKTTPDEIIEAAEAGRLDIDSIADIMITWNPGKKGQTHELKQGVFSIKDSVLTRQQLDKTLILNRRAAERIVDFCPDMLWRSMLLRITSEAGYGNKDVRDRFCYNGCYCDKATITKRISAALGQKQTQPKSRAYIKSEWDWYDGNVQDFSKYIDYFGQRTSHRNTLKIQIAGEKRRAKAMAGHESTDDAKSPRPRKRARAKKEDAMDVDELGDGEDDEETEENEDAVSVQDDDLLDQMDED